MWTAYTYEADGTEITAEGATHEEALEALKAKLPKRGEGYKIVVVSPRS